jgi:hypothetical protein
LAVIFYLFRVFIAALALALPPVQTQKSIVGSLKFVRIYMFLEAKQKKGLPKVAVFFS